MNKLRAELAQLGTVSGGPGGTRSAPQNNVLVWQDARLADYDVQCVSESALAPPRETLGELSRVGRYWNLRYSSQALMDPVAHFLSLRARGSQRIANLELLSSKLAPFDFTLENWLAEPLEPGERILAAGLERLWGCSRERRASLAGRIEPVFHQIYESTPLATLPLRLARLGWLGRALLAATGTDGD